MMLNPHDSDMDLDSSPSPSNVPDPVLRPIRPTPPGELSLFVLRPTDTCLKDLGRLGPGAPLSLHVDSTGTTGTLVIGNGRRHAFSLGKPTGSELDVIQDRGQGGDVDCRALGTIMARLQIAATDDVYEQTRKAAVLANAEAKKKQAKELKSGSGRHGAVGGGSLSGIGKAKSMVRKVESHPAPSSSNSQPASASSGQTGSGIAKRPIRQRIMQLLVLKPYSKAELLLRLQQDGLSAEDKARVDSILHEVGSMRSSMQSQSGQQKYSLARSFYSQVTVDWPYYQPYDKQNVKRILDSVNSNAAGGPSVGDDIPTARKRPALKPPSAKSQKKTRTDECSNSPARSPSRPPSQLKGDLSSLADGLDVQFSSTNPPTSNNATATVSSSPVSTQPTTTAVTPEPVMYRGRNTESTNGLDSVFGAAAPAPPPVPPKSEEPGTRGGPPADVTKGQQKSSKPSFNVGRGGEQHHKKERKEPKESGASNNSTAPKNGDLDVISDLLDKASGSGGDKTTGGSGGNASKSEKSKVIPDGAPKATKSEKRHGTSSDGKSKKKDRVKGQSPKKGEATQPNSTSKEVPPKMDVLSAQNGPNSNATEQHQTETGKAVDVKSKKIVENSPKRENLTKPGKGDGRADQNSQPSSLAPCTLTIKERRKIESDFPTPIASPEQRQNYSAEFKRDYAEYTQVYEKLNEVGRRFETYEESLDACEKGSEQYTRLEHEIQSAYADLCRDGTFQTARQRHAYLRHKLQHLKTAVADWDRGS